MIVDSSLSDIIPLYTNTFISLTGGGGKTTIMQDLAQKYRSMGKTVMMTTTTKVQSPEVYNWRCDCLFTDCGKIRSFFPDKPCSILFACKSEIAGKLTAPDSQLLRDIAGRFDVVLCEADGSGHRPLKIHTQRDPVIPAFNDWTVCIAGSWAFGQIAEDVVFGVPDSIKGMSVDTEFLNRYVSSEEGLLKGTKENRRCIVITKTDEISPEYIDFWDRIKEKVVLYLLSGEK